MYHKGFRQSGKTKVIHRYLPRENVQHRMKQKNRRSAFLWADEVVSKEGRKESKIWHVKIRRRGGGLGEGDGDRDGEDEKREQEQKEEEAAFMDWFREPKWTSDRVRRVLQRYSTQFSGQEINISAWRQMAIGISNRYLNKVFKEGVEGGGEFDEGEDDDGDGGWGYNDMHAVAPVFRIRGGGPGGAVGGQAGAMRVRRRTGRDAAEAVQPIAPDGHEGAVAADDGTVGGVPGIAGARHPGGGTGRVADRAGDADGGRQEFDVHVAGVLHAGRGDGGDHAVGVVGGRHGGAVFRVRDRRVHLDKPMRAAGGVVGVRDARVGRQQGVQGIRRADARAAQVGPGRGGRVPHGFGVQQDVPAADGAVGRDVAGFRGAGDLFDGDVEAGAGGGVFQGDAIRGGQGQVVPRGDDEAEHRVQGGGDGG
ncbi:hypothetical protein FOMA001_g17997 [Fusarium oxysporum f. sp. matthiolae]|nr:hypothetical protein FOMA001_g17997 [Fusarium oxysporum f. sp. matthiolae]